MMSTGKHITERMQNYDRNKISAKSIIYNAKEKNKTLKVQMTENGGHLHDVQSLAHGVVFGGQVGPVHLRDVGLAHAHEPQCRSLLESACRLERFQHRGTN